MATNLAYAWNMLNTFGTINKNITVAQQYQQKQLFWTLQIRIECKSQAGPQFFLISPKSRVAVNMNDHFIEKVVIWYGTNFVEIMIAFEGSWKTLFSHKTNHFLDRFEILHKQFISRRVNKMIIKKVTNMPNKINNL